MQRLNLTAERELLGSRCSIRWTGIRPFSRSALLGILLAGMASPAFGQAQWTGAVDDDWFDQNNWSGNAVPTDSDSVDIDNGAVTIRGGGAEAGDASIRSLGSVTVTDSGTSWIVPTLFIEGGILTAQARAVVRTDILFFNSGTLSVRDAGTEFEVAGDFIVGRDSGTLTFTVENGGHFSAGRSFFGEGGLTVQATSLTARVTGPGSRWDAGNFLSLGGNTVMEARITVENGGLLNVDGGAQIGRGGLGALIVTGAGSELRVNNAILSVGDFFNGASGNGTLTVEDGALVSAGALRVGGGGIDSIGSLNLNGTAGARGVVAIGSLFKGDGDASVLFDGGILRAIQNTTSFIANFEDDDLVIDTGGLIIDTNGFDVTAASVLSGTGALEKTGQGTLTFTATNSYAGGTTISAGILQLGNGGTTGSIVGNVVNNAVLAFNRSDSVTFDSVISGSGSVRQDGTGTTILSGANSYAGGTILNAGTLRVSADVNLGDAAGGLTFNGGTLNSTASFASARAANLIEDAVIDTDAATTLTLGGVLSGPGALIKTGAGTLNLTGANSYSGGTTITAGALRVGDGGTGGSITGDVVNDGTLIFSRADERTFGGLISGSGGVSNVGSGTLILTGDNSYAGPTSALAGTLIIDGDQSTAAGPTSVQANATLGGNGTIGGNVGILGRLAPGSAGAAVGTLTINGDLTLGAGAQLDFQFGEAGVAGGLFNDLVNVAGDLILDGTLNIAESAGGTFGPGIYRVFNYGGTLIDGGLSIGAAPAGSDLFVQTSIAQQINLVNTAGLTLNVWDGPSGTANDRNVTGGNGIWRLGGGENHWTEINGEVNADYANGSFAIFQGTAGTVDIANNNGAVTASGLQIATDGYVLNGDALTLVGAVADIRVGDGTANGAGVTATIDAEVTGAAALNKTDLGTLILTGANSYTGGTIIGAGTLRISDDASLGDTAGSLTFDGGTLNSTASFASARAVNLLSAGRVDTDAATSLNLGGSLSGAGSLEKFGAGTLILTGTGSYAGGTTIAAGVLQIGNGGTTGSIVGDVSNNGTLVFERSDDIAFDGAVSGTGGLRQAGSGTLVLTGANTYAGGTTITGGSLQIGDGGTVGAITGNVANDGVLAFNRSDSFAFAGVISGSGAVRQDGPGVTILSGANTYTGGTVIGAGTLQITADANLGDAGGDVDLDGGVLRTTASFSSSRDLRVLAGGAIETAEGTTFSFDGLVSGNGPLGKSGGGVLQLSGDNVAFAGPVTVEAGTLALTGTLGSNVIVSASGRLEGDGTLGSAANAGVVAPGNAGFGTLTVTGDYVGNGGTIEIETILGGDSSTTDRLVIGGATSGTSRVTVVNRNGIGAQTVEGIRIIEVAGASDGIFVLNGDYLFEGEQAIIAGAYAYRLVQNGVTDPSDGDWYLRSALIDPAAPTPPVPLYQPGVPVYEGYGAVLQSLNGLPTLQQRVAGRSLTPGRNDIWGRLEGLRQNAEPRRSTSAADQRIDAWRIQIGVDRALVGAPGGNQLVAGISGHYGEARARTKSVFGDGRMDTNGYGFGLSLTWRDIRGFYADAQAQFSWYDSNLRSDILGELVRSNDGSGEAFSLEVGHIIPLGSVWSLTPQAQLLYGNVRFDAFVDPSGANISIADGDSLRSRTGLSVDRRVASGDIATHIYAIANVNVEWLGGSRTEVAGTPIVRADHRVSGELGIGASVRLSNGVTFYGEAAIDSPFSDLADSTNLRANAGVRIGF